jgi:hypothetical protein
MGRIWLTGPCELALRGDRATRRRRGALAAALLAVLLSTAAAAPALADSATPLGGQPLAVYVGEHGQLQAFRSGSPSGIFFPPSEQVGDAGFFLALPSGYTGDASPRVFGFTSFAGPSGIDEFTPISQSPATGTGTASDPLQQVTRYVAEPSGGPALLSVTQTTTYVNGAQQFQIRWDVHNGSPGAVTFKALAAADFYFDGSDRGTGIYTEGPPRFIGGTNADTGNSGGMIEASGAGLAPWSAYQALEWGPEPNQIWGKVDAAASTAPTFDDTVLGEPVDNAGGVEWDQDATGAGLAAGATRSFAISVSSAIPSALQLTPSNGGSPQGVPLYFRAVATNTAGVPYAGRPLQFQITGANPGSGTITLDGNGSAVIPDPGANAGADTVIAYVDFNGDQHRQPAEPQASALGTFVDHTAPSCKVKVSGDRLGGGGAGKPLVIVVDCSEPAKVTAAVTLQPGPTVKKAGASASRTKPVKVKLKPTSATVKAGQTFSLKLAIPAKVRTKYAGSKLKAQIKLTVRDTAGNVKKIGLTKTIKLAKVRKAK